MFQDPHDSTTEESSEVSNVNVNECHYVVANEYKPIINCSDSFYILQANCRSLLKFFEMLQVMLMDLSITPSVIAISETWLSVGAEIYYNLPNYSFVSLPQIGKKVAVWAYMFQINFLLM